MKKWFITFSTESPISTGFAVISARDPKQALLMLKIHSTTFNKGAIILSMVELDGSPDCGCNGNRILAEGVTQLGVMYTPHVKEDGTLYWTNNGDLVNPTPIKIVGGPGKDGEKGEKGDKGDTGELGKRGLQGPRGEAFTYDMFTEELLANLVGPQGPQGTSIEVQYSSDNISYHNTVQSTDIYLRIKLSTETEWSQGLLVKGLQGEKGDKAVLIVDTESEITDVADIIVLAGSEEAVNLATIDDVPTKLSLLLNDSNFMTLTEVNTKISSALLTALGEYYTSSLIDTMIGNINSILNTI